VRYQGRLFEAASQLLDLTRPGGRLTLLREAQLGRHGAGRSKGSRAHVVVFHGVDHQQPWLLVTSIGNPHQVVDLYRRRMLIEAEFRDLKGPWGLDELANWLDLGRVARFLAWVAVYEWRLAALWLAHRLWEWAPHVVVHGRLSWIRI